MNKYITTQNGGNPAFLNDLRFVLGQNSYSGSGLYNATEAHLKELGSDFKVNGCVVGAVIPPTYSITEGWILLDNELLKVESQLFNITTAPAFIKSELSFNSDGNKTFQNGDTHNTYNEVRAILSGTTGSLHYSGATYADRLRNELTIPLKQKVLDIGDWNMNTTSNVNVAHGLSDKTRIREVNIMIQDDALNLIHKLESDPTSQLEMSGWVDSIDNTNISLQRLTGGFFDSSNFQSVSPTLTNRGWVTIWHTD